jgi:hypothetical protein
VDTLSAEAKTLDQLERSTLGDRVLLLLDARADARRRGFTRRTPVAFERAVLEVLTEKVPPGGLVIGRHRDADFTSIVLPPEQAARWIVENYSPLADKLRTHRAARARFQLDDRTTRLRRKRRTRQTHI